MRLTKTSNSFGGMVWFRSQDRNDLWLEPCEMTSHDSRRAIDELAAYEDAEEQGLLVRLPCKVGDKVYALERFCDGNKGDCYSWLKCEECEDYQQEVSERRIGTLVQAVSVIEMLGKTVFLTREEAEAALKEELECQIQDKHGKWINPHWQSSMHCMNCNQCKYEAQHSVYHGVEKYYHYCPNCGAKMDLEDNEE